MNWKRISIVTSYCSLAALAALVAWVVAQWPKPVEEEPYDGRLIIRSVEKAAARGEHKVPIVEGTYYFSPRRNVMFNSNGSVFTSEYNVGFGFTNVVFEPGIFPAEWAINDCHFYGPDGKEITGEEAMKIWRECFADKPSSLENLPTKQGENLHGK